MRTLRGSTRRLRLSVGLAALSALTLGRYALADTPDFKNSSLPFDKRVADLISRLTLEEKAQQVLMYVPANSRLGIPACHWWTEAAHGVARAGQATVFPDPIAMAASWDPPLLERVAVATADEARAKLVATPHSGGEPGAYRGIIIWSPTINMARDPRWGRTEETYSEDPYLTARLAVPFIKGLQGDDPKYLKTVATPKHFAMYSQETGRTGRSFKVSERAMHEYYLPAFQACITEGKAASIMVAYNGINNVPSTANSWLLTDILRDQWKFQGAVVTDFISIEYLVNYHHYVNSYDKAVAAAINAGVDIMCDEVPLAPAVVTAVKSGLLKEETLNRSLSRSLMLRFRLGMFDPPELVPFAHVPPSVVGSTEHKELALQMARESIVLLKNDGAPRGYGFEKLLPLDLRRINSMAVVGPYARTLQFGAYSGTPANTAPTILNALKDAVGDRVIIRTADYTDTQASVQAAQDSDVAIAVVGLNGRVENEGFDRSTLELPVDQRLFLERILRVNPLTIIVLEGGSPIGLSWMKEHFPAIVMLWYPGEQGGPALADVLLGACNPAGRLPITFYSAVEDLPPLDDYEISKGRTYMYLTKPPCYPFGHGLSYTTFSYANLQITPPRLSRDSTAHVSLDLSNTGQRGGDEVAQLYVRKKESSITRPLKELKGFQRISISQGQTRRVEFDLPASALTYWDEGTHQFVVEPGVYEVMIGASSGDIRLRGELTINASQ